MVSQFTGITPFLIILSGLGNVGAQKFISLKFRIKLNHTKITHFEIFNVFIAPVTWGPEWRGKKLLSNLANMTSSSNNWMQCTLYDIGLVASHCSGIIIE